MNEPLGLRALTSARVWITAVLATWSFCEGAGMATASLSNGCGSGPLFYQSVFPPEASFASFFFVAVAAWVQGLYDYGLTFGFFTAVLLTLCGTRLSAYQIEKVFCFAAVVAAGITAGLFGYFFAINHTIQIGTSPCAL